MKKVLVSISILLLVFWCFSALAEGIDLSEMTTDELIDLQIRIQDELYTRDRFMDCFLYPGDYVIGEDIEPGDYLIHCVPGEKYYTSHIYADMLDTGKTVVQFRRIEQDGLVRANLPEGSVLHLADGVIELLPR